MKQLKQKKELQNFLNSQVKERRKLFFFFDYDGVLVPIQDNPNTAFISKTTKNNLLTLLSNKKIKIALVSGRSLNMLRKLSKLKSKKLIFAGSHGLEIFLDGKSRILYKHNHLALKKIRTKAYKLAKSIANGFLEDKPYTFAYHIRDSRKEDLVKKLNYKMRLFLKKHNLKNNFKVLEGKRIVEIMSSEVTKGKTVEKIIKLYPNYQYFYFGDDITDISAFKIMKKYKGVSISLNPKLDYKADFLIKSQGSLNNLLKNIVNTLGICSG